MSTATALAKAKRARASIEAKGSRILLRHDPRTVDPATGAPSGGSAIDYPVFGLVESLSLRAGEQIQAGDVRITVAAGALPSRPTPAGWSVYLGGGDPLTWPVPGASGVERLTVVDGGDPIQESGVSLLYQLHCRR